MSLLHAWSFCVSFESSPATTFMGPFWVMRPFKLDDPGLYIVSTCILTRQHRIYSPSLQPNCPWHTVVGPCGGGKRAFCMLKAPEEQCIVRVPAAVHVDVASVVVRKGKVYAGEAVCDLKVWYEKKAQAAERKQTLRKDLQDFQSEL